jgi:hypothetical protein
MNEELRLVVVPREEDVAAVRSGIGDIAFDAATGIAQLADVEIASDEFNVLYRRVRTAYEDTAAYLLYFLHLGVLTVKSQMDMATVNLIVPANDIANVDNVVSAILEAAKPVAACLLHTHSVGEEMLISDAEILDLPSGVNALAVDFHLGGHYHYKEAQ